MAFLQDLCSLLGSKFRNIWHGRRSLSSRAAVCTNSLIKGNNMIMLIFIFICSFIFKSITAAGDGKASKPLSGLAEQFRKYSQCSGNLLGLLFFLGGGGGLKIAHGTVFSFMQSCTKPTFLRLNLYLPGEYVLSSACLPRSHTMALTAGKTRLR